MKRISNRIIFKEENIICSDSKWDTNYFGVSSARVILNGEVTKQNQETAMEKLQDFRFVTIVNSENLNHNNIWLGGVNNTFLTDVNIQFEKKINQSPSIIDKDTNIYNLFSDNKIEDIAKQAFKYSRFTNDPHLSQEKTKSIYLHWTKSAFNKSDKYFIITEREKEVAGYILFSINNSLKTVVIELIAVDEKFRGTKVGLSLMSKLEEYVRHNKLEKINVGTQLNNIIAANFYMKNGYQYKNCNSIYHMWNE